MATSVAFTDGVGAATLTNGRPVPADRFSAWTPDADIIGPRRVTVGDGITRAFEFRRDRCASFLLENIPNSSQSVMERLKLHLESGGTATVTTGDLASRTYTARIRPGTRVEIELSDRRRLLYTMRFAMKNTAAAAMLCIY